MTDAEIVLNGHEQYYLFDGKEGEPSKVKGMKTKALADKTRYLKDSPEGVSEMCKAIEDKRAISLGISYGEAQRRSKR